MLTSIILSGLIGFTTSPTALQMPTSYIPIHDVWTDKATVDRLGKWHIYGLFYLHAAWQGQWQAVGAVEETPTIFIAPALSESEDAKWPLQPWKPAYNCSFIPIASNTATNGIELGTPIAFDAVFQTEPPNPCLIAISLEGTTDDEAESGATARSKHETSFAISTSPTVRKSASSNTGNTIIPLDVNRPDYGDRPVADSVETIWAHLGYKKVPMAYGYAAGTGPAPTLMSTWTLIPSTFSPVSGTKRRGTIKVPDTYDYVMVYSADDTKEKTGTQHECDGFIRKVGQGDTVVKSYGKGQ